jgi:hypothetical protein
MGLFGPERQAGARIQGQGWLGGSQIFLPFPPFRLEEDFSQRYFHKIVQTSDLPENVRRYLRSLDVVLCNNYYRW